MSSIPASAIVQVTPSVIGSGGTALDLQGLLLTENDRVPIDEAVSFASSDAVTTYFGGTTDESSAGSVYFSGFDNSTQTPGSVMFFRHVTEDAPAWIRGGDISGLSLAELQAVSGTLTLTFGGVVKTVTVDISGSTSFSDAVDDIMLLFSEPSFSGEYDSVSGGMIFTSTVDGAESTIVEATGTAAAALMLTTATGATLSQGADARTPAETMTAAKNYTTNWAVFTTLFDPDVSGNDNKKAFAAWNTTQNDRFGYICWDTDSSPTSSSNASSSMGQYLIDSNTSGTCLIYAPDYTKAVMIAGFIPSLDFEETNGRTNMAFRAQSGQTADVTTITAHDNLISNGYNFYGKYATGNDSFTFLYPGSVSGDYKWFDSYVIQIWLNNAFQLAMMSMLTTMKSIPYNDTGRAIIRAWCMDPITAAINFGGIQAGVSLSSGQKSAVNSGAGMEIDSVLFTQGWYLQVLDATAQVRGARTSPPIKFWYMDGGSVNSISISSIEVQ